jgi:hypothetical protein
MLTRVGIFARVVHVRCRTQKYLCKHACKLARERGVKPKLERRIIAAFAFIAGIKSHNWCKHGRENRHFCNWVVV